MSRTPSQAQRRFADQAQAPTRFKRHSDAMDELRPALRENAESIARSLLGEPNRTMSSAYELRFGSKGAISIALQGDQAGIWHDFANGDGGDALDLIMRERRCDFTAALVIARDLLCNPILGAVRPTLTKPAKALVDHGDLVDDIWRQTVPIAGTLGESYLNRRGLSVPADIADLRFHPSCPKAAERFPAMVGGFRDIYTNELCGIVRVFLTPQATKIDGNAKMMLGRVAGAAIKFSPNDQVETGLCIAEGVETALGLLNFGFAPAWALGSAGGILAFPVLAGIEALTIAVDQDEAGQKSSAACGARWRSADREVRFIHALAPGADIADLAKGEPQ